MSGLGYARAVFDFVSGHHEDVSLKAGDVVQVLEEVDCNWLKGKNHNKVGYFPASYIEPLSLPHGQHVFLALKPFLGEVSEDLNFNEGDLIIGLQPIDNNWWNGSLNGRSGIFPLTHVTQLHPAGSGCNLWQPKAQTVSSVPSSQTAVCVGSRVVAVHDLTAQLDDELTISRGDVINILHDLGDGFAIGECNGRVGQFPMSFVEYVDKQTSAPDTKPDSSASVPFAVEKPSAVAAFKKSHSRKGSYTLANTRSPDCSVVPYCSTVHAFTGNTAAGELSFGIGEIVRLISHVNDDWCYGELDGAHGIFPTSFVEIIVDCNPSNDEAPAAANGYGNVGSSVKSSAQNSSVGGEVYGRVLFDYRGEIENGIVVREGDTVTVLRHHGPDWLEVKHDNGSVGYCPSLYVELFSAEPLNTKPTSSKPTPSSKPKPPLKPKSLSTSGSMHLPSPRQTSSPPVSSPLAASKSVLPSPAVSNHPVSSPVGATSPTPHRIPVSPPATTTVSSHPARSSPLTVSASTMRSQQVSPAVSTSTASAAAPAGPIPSLSVPSTSVSGFRRASSVSTQMSGPPVAMPRLTSMSKQHPSNASLDEMIFAELSSVKGCQQGSPTAGRKPDMPSSRNLNNNDINLKPGRSSWETFSDTTELNKTSHPVKPPPPPRPSHARPSIPTRDLPLNVSPLGTNGCQQRTQIRGKPGDLMQFSPDQNAQVVVADDEMALGNSSNAPLPPSSTGIEDLQMKHRETRENVLSELLSTEIDYCECMKLCADTFWHSSHDSGGGTSAKSSSQSVANGCSPLLADEMETLFANVDDVVSMSHKLIMRLTSDVKQKTFDQQIAGLCFVEMKAEIQKVYATYCRNHDNVIAVLEKYENNEEVMEFISEKLEIMRQQMTIFDLGSILIKPVQRILKYPLLLSELIKTTEDSHPDKQYLVKAVAAMTDVAAAVNELKRRKDLVLKYKKDPKLSERLTRLSVHSTKKKLTRIGQKMVGVQTVDENFAREEQKYRALDAVIRNLTRDVSVYLEQLEESMSNAEQVAMDFREYYEEEIPEVEGLCIAYSIINATLLTKFKSDVERDVIPPLNTLLLMFQGPANVIRKRYDKLLDFENASKRWSSVKESDIDTATREELGKVRVDYEAINAQLLDDLPRLFELSVDILHDSLHHLLRLQHGFFNQISEHLTSHLGPDRTQAQLSNIVETFNIAHAATVERMSALQLIPTTFNPHAEEIRRSTASRPISSSTDASQTVGNQSESHKSYLCSSFPEDRLYVVSDNYVGSQLMDLTLMKGTLVGIIKQGDPMGNHDRWFVDSAVAKGFVPKHFLSPRKQAANEPRKQSPVVAHKQSPKESQRDLLSWTDPIQPPVDKSHDIIHLLDPLSSASPVTSPVSYEEVFSQMSTPRSSASVTPGANDQLTPGNKTAQANTSSWQQFNDDMSHAGGFQVKIMGQDVAVTKTSVVESVTSNRCRVLYTFAARDSSEVSITEGEIIRVLQRSDLEGNSEWWFVTKTDGQQGYVPANYLQNI